MNALELVSANLSDLIKLPDEQAAPALNRRIMAWNVVDELHERSYVERGLIAIQVEKRQLWKFLIDPDTNTLFSCMDAWMSCSQFLGCRRTNYEAKRSMKLLEDVPPEKLIDVPKGNIHTLTQLSTHVRNDPAILEAAKNLPQKQFLEKIEREQPLQHLEARGPLRLSPTKNERKDIDDWVQFALDHDLAGSVTEAIAKACQMAKHDAELDEELKAMQAEEAVKA
jgi:hypothetical protein